MSEEEQIDTGEQESGSSAEEAREYLRRVLAFKGITPLTWGLICVLAATAAYLAWPLASDPNFYTYVLIALLFTREFSSSQMKRWADRKGWMPQSYPPPSGCRSYLQTHAKVAKILEMGFWVCFVGGFVVRLLLQAKAPPSVQFYVLLGSIGFLLAGFWWDFAMSGLWEKLLMFGSLGGAGVIWTFTTSPPALGLLVFGGGFVAAGVFLLMRWWSWTRTL